MVIHQKLNPFDIKVTKLKHDVGGRKLKGVTGRPAQSKQAGIEQRKKTLLKEYEQKGRAGGIVDRRFGENDPSMTLDERMLERFTRERQRASKASVFNLDDEDELTHYGQSLSKLDDFDNVGLVQDDQKKSKAEVMAEVMAKSKQHKLIRQLEREHGDDICDKLDQEFDSLRSLLYAPNSSAMLERPDNYDQHVRELAFDKRAKPKDRTKTEEELALEEKEALEEAEHRRQRRMVGKDEDGSGDDDVGEEEEGAVDVSDSEADEGEDDSEISEGETGEHEGLIPQKKSSMELPFTFSCPSSHAELLNIVREVADEDFPTIIQRIRTLYHPSLSPDNKLKLQNFTTVLIDHVLYITSPPSPRFTLLSSLLPHLYDLSKSYPIQSAEYFVQKLSLMHKNLKRGLSRGALNRDAKTWPGLAELSLLRTIGVIWPTSDMNHAVVSPTRLLMGAYLGLGRVRSLCDIASGLFLCTLFLQFETLSKRLVPEAINLLVNTVLHLAPHGYKDVASLPGSFPTPDFGSDLCLPLSMNVKGNRNAHAHKPNLVAILSGNDGDEEQDKVDLLGLAFDLIGRFAEMYKSLDGFIELYEPLHEVLLKVDCRKLPTSLGTRLNASSGTIDRMLKFSRQSRRPLLLQAHKPIPIPTYIPKFDVSTSSYLRHQDPDKDRKEASKLRNQVKQERKGAIRELRKDARFLAAVQQKKQAQRDQEYNTRMKRVFGSLESERAEEKAMEREKSRAKKRARRT